MATIDLIVLGILSNESLSAYDIQKMVEYRNISRWVKVSTPSIYKKVLQLETKGYIKGVVQKEGNMSEKTVYSLTSYGRERMIELMIDISKQPIHLFIDFNAVIVNLDSLSLEHQKLCLESIENNIASLKKYLKDNVNCKEDLSVIPETGKAVLRQQLILVEAIEEWIGSVRLKITDL